MGSRKSPTRRHRRAEPVAGHGRRLRRAAGSARRSRTSRSRSRRRRRWSSTPGARRMSAQVDQRVDDPPLPARPRSRARTADGGEQPEDAGRGPAPRVALADAEQQRRQRERQQRGADPVDARLARAPATRARTARWPSAAQRRVATREPEDPRDEPMVDEHARRSRGPTPPPMPNIAEIVPMPVATLSRGNSSRMIPMASGKIAPPAPWIARPAIMTPSEPARAATSEPSAEDRRARSAASAPCRTCRPGGRAAASRSTR